MEVSTVEKFLIMSLLTDVITFDNEFSYVRSKKVLYMASVVEPSKLTEE